MNQDSKNFTVNSGIGQGSCSGPIYFNIFFDDSNRLVDQFTLDLSFADDKKIARAIKNDEDLTVLQEDVSKFYNWCKLNDLEINLNKCFHMSFSRNRNHKQFDIIMNGTLIQKVEQVTDLGVILDPQLNFNLHIDHLVSKASKMLGFIKRSTKDFQDSFAIKTLYTVYVRSVLEPACLVWSPFYKIHCARIERVQNNATRFILRNQYGYSDMPSSNARNDLLSIDSLQNRRTMLEVMFISDLLGGKIDAPEILMQLNIKVPTKILRRTDFFEVPSHRTNYGKWAPITRMASRFNSFYDVFDFNVGRETFKKELLEKIRSDL